MFSDRLRNRPAFPLGALLVGAMSWGAVGALGACNRPTEFYVSPSGDDSSPGSLERPWRSLGHALGRLRAGDDLFLREGVYHENTLRVRVRGRAESPITIQSFPGEHATIDGGTALLTRAPNDAWEVVDPAIQLYRSRANFQGQHVRAWFLDAEMQILEYEDARNLEATYYGPVDGQRPMYVGPGLQLRDDGHLYIRLQSNPRDLLGPTGDELPPLFEDTNPNHHRIAVSTARYMLRVERAEHVRFKDLTLAHANYIMDIRESHHVELDGVAVIYGRYGFVFRDDGNSDWRIHDSTFDNQLPPYVHWTDVKNRPMEVTEAYPEFQSDAINGTLTRTQIRRNTFRNAFDAILLQESSAEVDIADNVFVDLLDDAINVSKGVTSVEIACNVFLRTASGIANLPSDVPAGPVFVHHNIIDNVGHQRGGRVGNYREEDWPVWTTLDPFGRHGDGDKAAWWRIYNNTIVTRRGGYRYSPGGPTTVSGNPEKYVFNNIFYVTDDRVVYRGDLESSGSHYDGNVFFRRAPGDLALFLDFGDGADYDSLDAFRRSGSSWESNGLEVDPGLDVPIHTSGPVDRAAVWERYRPSNELMFELGASYDGLSWPGTEGVDYRGAVSRDGFCELPASPR